MADTKPVIVGGDGALKQMSESDTMPAVNTRFDAILTNGTDVLVGGDGNVLIA